MPKWSLEPVGGTLQISDPDRADFVPSSGTSATASLDTAGDEAIAIQSLEPGTRLIVQTLNSQYHVVVLHGPDLVVIVKGGQLFQNATRVRLDGAIAGGGCLKIGCIGVGLRMVMSVDGRRFVTSPVRWIASEGVSPFDSRHARRAVAKLG